MKASLSVLKTLREKEIAINRPLCFQSVSPASNMCSLEERSIHCSKYAFFITWNKEFYHAFPPFWPITQLLNRIERDKTNCFFLITPCWQAVMVPPNIEHVDKETSNPSIQKTTKQSFRTNSPSCNKSNPYISGMHGFRGYLFEKGVSVKVANRISNSRRQSSLPGYESPWKKWSSWYDWRTVNHFGVL